jgi:N-acetylmuramoyl-L-alanine amidase-like protein
VSRRWSRVRLASLIALFLLALLPNFGRPAHASPRASGQIVANEVLQTRPAARELGTLSRPSAFPQGSDAGATGGDTLLFTSQVLDAGQLFDRLGTRWIAAPGAEESIFVEVRVSKDGVAWTDWTALPHDEDMRDFDRNEQYAGPFEFPVSRYAQYRTWLTGGSTDALGQLGLTFMDVTDVNAGPVAQLINDITGAFADMWHSYADAVPIGAQKILTRQDWGADESLMKWAPKYQRVQKAIIHHTVTDDGGTNPAATIRSMYYFHAVTRGWGDIGYNYLVDKYGNIWTGRSGGDHVIAGHAYGWNNGSIGVAAIGDYSTKLTTSTMQNGIATIIAMKFKQFGIQPFGADTFTHQEQAANGTWVNVTSNAPNIQGHRDANYIVSQHGGQTACPGNGIYNIMNTLKGLAQAQMTNGYFQLPYIEPSMPKAAFPGTPVPVSVTVFNKGEVPIAAGTGVSYRIYRSGTLITQGPVVPLSAAIAPNAAGTASVSFVPPAVGSYTVRWDLQTNGQWWYSLYNTPVRDVAFRSADWSVDWVRDNVPINWTAGETRVITVTATNDGGRTWPATGTNPVRLGYKWVSNATGNVFPGANRSPLAVDVQPGTTLNMVIPVTAPVYPTNYTLIIDLYKENEFAFADKGVAPDDTPTGVSVDFKAAYNVPVGAVLTAPSFTAGQTVTVPVIVTNTGQGTFPTTSSYPVNLGYHWYNSAGAAVVWDGARTKLPGDLASGQSVNLNATVAAPTTPGTYSLRFDLVQEGVAWFSLKGATATNFTVNVAGQLVPSYGAGYSSGVPSAAIASTTTSVPIILTNNSNFPWPAAGPNPVTLSYHWSTLAGATVVWDGLRTKLAADLQPGQSVQLQANLAFPSAAGTYTLRWDLVHEGISWFSGKGAPASAKQVSVSPYVAPFYGGAFIVDDVPTTLAPSLTTTVPVKVFNFSNFDWGSDVNLSYHWYDAAGKVMVWDGLRTSLAGMKVGEIRIVSMNVATPAAIGSYILRPDIAREGVTWFSGQGMMLPSRTIAVAVPPYGATYQTAPNIGAGLNTITTLPVTITNTGSLTWQPGAFNLSYHLYAASGNVYVWDGLRSALPTAVAPGQTVTVTAIVRVPTVAGQYRVAFDLVREGVAWFSTQNVPTGSSTLQAQ